MADALRRRPAVFLDRDGTLSEEIGYMRDISRYSVFPWTGKAIRRINDFGIAVVVVTNQSGIGRGFFEAGLVDEVHECLREEIGRDGAHIDAIYYCPHHPDDACECRKPKPGLIHQASAEMHLDPDRSFMIGDRYTDIRAGASSGAQTILVLTGDGARERTEHSDEEVQPDHVARTLDEAVDLIVDSKSGGPQG